MTHQPWTCPVCHSDETRTKVHIRGEWWARCFSGLDHGLFVNPETGEDTEWDVTKLYFSRDGRISYPDLPLNSRIIRQERTTQ